MNTTTNNLCGICWSSSQPAIGDTGRLATYVCTACWQDLDQIAGPDMTAGPALVFVASRSAANERAHAARLASLAERLRPLVTAGAWSLFLEFERAIAEERAELVQDLAWCLGDTLEYMNGARAEASYALQLFAYRREE